MARKRHEEHRNHEAWAIPYGDLLTLLLAFFVVMYSISSVNEGKYRVLSDALSEAFGGPPKSMTPIQIGENNQRGTGEPDTIRLKDAKAIPQSVGGTMRDLQNPTVFPGPRKTEVPSQQLHESGATGYAARQAAAQQLQRMGDEIQKAMGDLITRKMVIVKRTDTSLEVQIRTDILYTSGSSSLSESARPVLNQLAGILKKFDNPMRIEGHTDNVPIHTAAFPSNWELSAARAASVVHLFMDQGVDGKRMSVAGFAQYRPSGGNETPEGRNQNRRVTVMVLMPEGMDLPSGLVADGGNSAGADPVAASATPADADSPAAAPVPVANVPAGAADAMAAAPVSDGTSTDAAGKSSPLMPVPLAGAP
jgi:chemotaxis protein MotB